MSTRSGCSRNNATQSGNNKGEKMSTADNKKVVEKFFDLGLAGDFEGLFNLFTPDATWQLPGTTAWSGEHPVPYVRRIIEQGMAPKFAGPNVWGPTRMIGEGDVVAVEYYSDIDIVGGKRYSNRYSAWFEIQDGKIVKLVEYMDTKLFYDIFLSEGDVLAGDSPEQLTG